jgi:hypothetical protein
MGGGKLRLIARLQWHARIMAVLPIRAAARLQEQA